MAMTPDDLSAATADGSIDTVVVAFADLYGRLMGKRYDASTFVGAVAEEGSHACEYLFTVDIEMDVVGGYRFSNWDTGYGDVHLVPDLTTLRRAGWCDRTAIVLCDVADRETHELVEIAPRTILRRQVERLAGHGLVARAASELEFYLFADSYREAAERGHRDLRRAGWYSEDYHLLQGARVEPYVGAARRALVASGIPVENSKGETGVGQHELNIHYCDVLEMADRHVLMKHAMKELADAHGVSVTFMAKPFADDAGSSSHLHLSLWDADGDTNAFASGPSVAGDGHTDTFRRFLAGWVRHTNEFTVAYAPTVNSYKRFVDESWAPTRIGWSGDNRTAGFRVVGSGAGRRIENRIPGADCNPYLAYAGSLASGIAGIEQDLTLPEPTSGDVYSSDRERVAATLRDAVDAFDAGATSRSAFGDEVVDHYVHFHRTEVARHDASVSDWERTRYFEQI